MRLLGDMLRLCDDCADDRHPVFLISTKEGMNLGVTSRATIQNDHADAELRNSDCEYMLHRQLRTPFSV